MNTHIHAKKWKLFGVFGLLLLMFSMVLPGPSAHAAGKIYYISPTGSDATGTGTITSPWQSWTKALPVLTSGDILYARGGTYTNQKGDWHSVSGASGAPITFAAYPGEVPVFDGSGVAAGNNFMNIQSSQWLVFDGLTIQNYPNSGIWLGYADATPSVYTENIVIQNSTFLNVGKTSQDHSIYVSWGNNNITIRYNRMDGGAGGAVHMYHYPGGSNFDIYNNVMSNNLWGVEIDDAHNNTNVYNNTFYNNTKSVQVSLYDTPAHPTLNTVIKNNVSYTTNGTGLTVDSANTGQVTEDYNLWYDSVSSTPISWGGSSYSVSGLRTLTSSSSIPEAVHSIQTDPLFVNNGTEFRLRLNSPAIDAGLTIATVTDDHEHISRPQGTAYDMGAYEQSSNLLPNASFESVSGSYPTYWANPYGTGTGASSSTTMAHTGTRSVQIVDSSSTNNVGLSSEFVDAAAGYSYTAEVYTYTVSGISEMYLEFFDSGNTRLGYQTVSNSVTGAWKQLSATGTAPTGTTKVRVLLYSNSANTGTSYFDDAKLIRNLAPNPSFENVSGTVPVSWTTPYRAGSTAASSSTTMAYSGTQSVQIADSSATLNEGLYSDAIPAVAGRMYTAKVYTYTVSGTSELYLEFYDSSGTRIGYQNVSNSVTGAWTLLSATGTAPVNTANIKLLLYSNIANTGTAYYDDASLEE